MKLKIIEMLGGDLTVVNSARASYLKKTDTLEDRDMRLIRYLAREGHMSPFRHSAVTLVAQLTEEERHWLEATHESLGSVIRPKLSDWEIGKAVYWTVSLQALAKTYQEAGAFPELQQAVRNVGSLLAPVAFGALTGLDTQLGVTLLPEPLMMSGLLDGQGYVRLLDTASGADADTTLVQFEVFAPLMVRAQWFKYARRGDLTVPGFHPNPLEGTGTGNGDDGGFDDPLFARNEASRRYVTLDVAHYIPEATKWRSKPENSKQGSGAPLKEVTGSVLTSMLEEAVERGMQDYEAALSRGVAPEQARLFLPNGYGLYTVWYWTASMTAVNHFLDQRLAHDAQSEIRDYAEAVAHLINRSKVRSYRKEGKQ